MNRRLFLGSLAAGAVQVPAFQNALEPGRLKIAAVELVRLHGERETLRGVDGQGNANPIHLYEEHRPKLWKDAAEGTKAVVPASQIYLRIATDKGPTGVYGPIDIEAAIVVDQQLRGFLVGKDPLAGEALWDKMYRLNRHSRAGHYLMAISAVDNAIWDLRGRYFNTPVYRLLGGPTRQKIEAYGSCLGFSLEPERVGARVKQLKDEGFRHQKWFFADGPGAGAAGMARNVALARYAREAGGEDLGLMFDAFMSWNLDYAIAWARQAEKYNPRWIEEAFPPDRMGAFADLRRATSIPVAAGEHLYGRWEVHDYLKAGAITVVQSDPEWCGGVTELIRICTVASLYDAQVIPHGHSVHAALHVVASQSPITCPLVEYLITKMRSYYFFEKDAPRPEEGHFRLQERPGFGIEFEGSRVLRQTALWPKNL